MIQIPDLINGLFELGGACVLLLNVKALLRDKRLEGVHWGPSVFFTAWGLWNLFYYPHLGQWWSFAGGCAIVVANSVWLFLIALYAWRRHCEYRGTVQPVANPATVRAAQEILKHAEPMVAIKTFSKIYPLVTDDTVVLRRGLPWSRCGYTPEQIAQIEPTL